MNLGFVILNAGLAGHTRTAVTIAGGLRAKGHQVIFLIGAQADARMIERDHFTVMRTRHMQSTLGYYSGLREDLAHLRDAYGVEIIHSFDDASLAQVASACKHLGFPFFFTLCGGPPVKRILAITPTISLSAEGKDALLRVTSLAERDIHVIPARINLEESATSFDQHKLAALRAKYQLPSDARVILRIARVASSYLTSIIHGLHAAARVYQSGCQVRFVHIGYVESAECYLRLQQEIEAVNQACGVPLAVTMQEEAMTAVDYLGIADIVIGAGRSAFEGMCCGKPTLVIGTRGYAGAVCAQTVASLAYVNFSGRDAPRQTEEGSIAAIARDVQQLCEDDEYYTNMGQFGRQYVAEYLDVNKAVSAYLQIYQVYSGKDYPDDWSITKHALLPIGTWKDKLSSSPTFGKIIQQLREFRRPG